MGGHRENHPRDANYKSINVNREKKLLPQATRGDNLWWLYDRRYFIVSTQHSNYSHRATFLYIPGQIHVEGQIIRLCSPKKNSRLLGFSKHYPSSRRKNRPSAERFRSFNQFLKFGDKILHRPVVWIILFSVINGITLQPEPAFTTTLVPDFWSVM